MSNVCQCICDECIADEAERDALRAEVEQLRAENERLTKDMAEQLDDSERIIAALVKERDEARAACTLAWQRICAERRWAYDPAMDPVKALSSRLDPESAFYEAFSLDSADAFAARAEKAERERDEARADYERARADFLRCAETQRAAFADAATDADLLRAEVERLGSAAEALEAEMKRITAYLKEPCMFSEPCDLCRTKAKVLAVVNARGEVRR